MPIFKDDIPVGSAVEDYAKAIYTLQSRADGAAVTTNALAERLDVTPASASAMVKKLATLELATHRPYHGVQLTDAGMRVALEVVRHHRLLETYLAQELGVPWDRVHDEAEVLEHVLSEDLERAMAAKLGDPTHDPHGDPIPTVDGEIAELPTTPFATLEVGARGVFRRISDANPEMLRWLAEQGIRPGDAFEVTACQPFGGPTTARFGAGEAIPLGGDLARAMRVELTA